MLESLQQYIRQVIVLLTLILYMSIGNVSAQQPIMQLDELKPGMKGIAKTVVQGTAIETFDVEILSILKQKGPAGDLILARVSGDVINRTNGIASGMSGSPVYIDGKLVGAVAYGWPMTDRRICMVTPIQDMLKLWELPADKIEGQKNTAGLIPVAAPLMVTGLGERAMGKLTEYLKPFGLMPVTSGSSGSADGAKIELEPGSAVGVQLMRGDIDMTAIGTVTYREGNKIIGFGHPFLRRGGTAYFMTSAYIHQTIPGLDNSFKLGTSLDLVGTVGQDRGAGIAGEIGRYPHSVPLRIHVKDKDSGRERDLFIQSIQDEQISPALVTTAAMQAIEQTIDRTGLGTSWVKINILGRNLPGDSLSRENMFFHPTDIGAGSLGELLEGLALILNNPFTPVEIMDVQVDVTIEKAIKVANIESVKAMKTSAKPGEIVPLQVTLQLYRGVTVTQMIDYTIPKEQAPGNVAILVRGGGTMAPLKKLLAQLGGQEAGLQKPDNLKAYLEDFVEREKNNEIVAEIMVLGVEKEAAEMMNPGMVNKAKPAVAEKKPQLPLALPNKDTQVRRATEYIIDGNAEVAIQVLGEVKANQKKVNK